MRKVLVCLLLVVCLSVIASAQDELSCLNDEDCLYLVGEGSVCDPETFLCTFSITPILYQQETTEIQSPKLQEISNKVSQLENQHQQLSSKLDSLVVQVEQIKKQELPKFNTGLASLQQEVQNTSEQVSNLQQDVSQKSSRWPLYVLIFLIIIGAFGAIIYFLRPNFNFITTAQKEVPDEIHQYITQNIKKGKKFPQIRQELLKAGWKDEEIKWAYKESTRKNYLNFMHKKNVSQTKSPTSLDQNKAKILTIVGITLFILIIALFALSKSSGFAIYTQKLISGSTNNSVGEVSYGLECTSPHILNPQQTSCCLDLNNNNICDFIDAQNKVSILSVGDKCVDNRQCGENLCINRICQPLTSIHQKPLSSCSKVCNFYSLDLSTSDKELYTLRPKQGSYTGAGSLEWTVLSTPNYCIEETPVILIQLTKKNPGKILNTEIITLREGETSKAIKHPFVKSLAFSITMVEIYQVCEPTEAELQQTLNKYNLQRSVMQVKKIR
jgi:hypothetical protein